MHNVPTRALWPPSWDVRHVRRDQDPRLTRERSWGTLSTSARGPRCAGRRADQLAGCCAEQLEMLEDGWWEVVGGHTFLR